MYVSGAIYNLGKQRKCVYREFFFLSFSLISNDDDSTDYESIKSRN